MVHPCCSIFLYFIPFYCQEDSTAYCIQHFVYPSIIGWTFGCFYLLAIVSNAAINIHVQVFVWTYIVTSLGYVSSSGIAGCMVALHLIFQ